MHALPHALPDANQDVQSWNVVVKLASLLRLTALLQGLLRKWVSQLPARG